MHLKGPSKGPLNPALNSRNFVGYFIPVLAVPKFGYAAVRKFGLRAKNVSRGTLS